MSAHTLTEAVSVKETVTDDERALQLERRLDDFEIDFIVEGKEMTLYWLLHAQLKRHLKDKVSGLRLHKSTSTRRKPRHSSSAKPQATNDGFQKLTTNAIQAVYSSSLPHIRVTATFETERFGQGALVFRVSAIDQEEQDMMKEPHYAGAQYGEYAIDEEDVHSGDDVNEVDWVRVYRCARPDACMQMPKLEKLPREQTEVMRLMGYTQLKAFVSGIFWQAYEQMLQYPPPPGQVLTMRGYLMKDLRPSRMDVPFSLVLTEEQLVDEAILFSAVWQAACDVRQYCTFDNWFTGRKPFDILGAYAYPLYGEDGTPGVDPEVGTQAIRLRKLAYEDRDVEREQFLSGPPFLIVITCRGRGAEVHQLELYVQREDPGDSIFGHGLQADFVMQGANEQAKARLSSPANRKSSQRLFRVSKVDFGGNFVSSDNVWNIQSFVDLVALFKQANGITALPRNMAVMGHIAKHIIAYPVYRSTKDKERLLSVTQKLKVAVCGAQLLSRKTILTAMRGVGLHVWDSSRIVETEKEPEFFLITAPLHVLAQRAELLKMRVMVNPDQDTGRFQGDFIPENFLRGGPMEFYKLATRKNPHPYPNYFADFTVLQRLQLVIDLLRRPQKFSHSSDRFDSSGGAGLNTLELLAEEIIANFFPMHVPFQIERFNRYWVRLPQVLRAEYARELKFRRSLARVTDGVQLVSHSTRLETALRVRTRAHIDSKLMAIKEDKRTATRPRHGGKAAPMFSITVNTELSDDSAREILGDMAAAQVERRDAVPPGQVGAGVGAGAGAGAGAGEQTFTDSRRASSWSTVRTAPKRALRTPKPPPAGKAHAKHTHEQVGKAAADSETALRAVRALVGTADALDDGIASGGDTAGALYAEGGDPEKPLSAHLHTKGCCTCCGRKCSKASRRCCSRLCCGCSRCCTQKGRCCYRFAHCCRRSYVNTIGQLDQPLSDVVQYFGTSVGFYFLWLEFYTKSLLYPAVLGLILVLIDWAVDTSVEVLPSLTVEHVKTSFYAIVVLLWATLCLEYFQKMQTRMAYVWDVDEEDDMVDQPIRREFISAMHQLDATSSVQTSQITILSKLFSVDSMQNESTKQRVKNRLRNDLEVYNELYFFPPKRRRRQTCISVLVATLSVLTVAVAVVLVLFLPPLLFPPKPSSAIFGVQLNVIVSGVANGVIIPILNFLYRKVAKCLVDREHHRFQSDFDNSLVVKLFAFQFVNSYASLLYIGFIQRDIPKLGSQLAGILITGQLLRTAKEHGLMQIKERWRAKASKQDDAILEADMRKDQRRAQQLSSEMRGLADNSATAKLLEAVQRARLKFDAARVNMVRRAILETHKSKTPDLIDEYLHIVIQFGYVSMFCAAFPLAALTAFITNLIEIRMDAHKFLISRRPFPQQASSIGVWFPIMQMLSVLAVLTNVAIIFLATEVTDDKGNVITSLSTVFPGASVGVLWAAVATEHVLIFIKYLLRLAIPMEPVSVQEDKFREQYFLLREDGKRKAEAERMRTGQDLGDDYAHADGRRSEAGDSWESDISNSDLEMEDGVDRELSDAVEDLALRKANIM